MEPSASVRKHLRWRGEAKGVLKFALLGHSAYLEAPTVAGPASNMEMRGSCRSRMHCDVLGGAC